jgi:peptide chain release factor 1
VEISVETKLESICKRYEELGKLLSLPEVYNDRNRHKILAVEYSELQPIYVSFNKYRENKEAIANTLQMLEETTDPELKSLAQDELQALKQQSEELETQIKILLIPTDPNDKRNVFLEIRAGAGGDEAAIFAGDLFRMYSRYAEQKGWRIEIINSNHGEHGGFKEIICLVHGDGAYSQLKFESGAHRVQRVPETEAQGRIHTSTCTVAVFPQAEEIDNIDINPADLKVDTFRASGAGGQHVNVTDSAVRITHLPTGTVVECQDERSQHKNRAKAMSLLQARILAKQRKDQAQTRRSLIGSGDRSERIRTYNFPQGRLTDHRINLTIYRLDEVMEGALDQVIEPLTREYQADLLANLNKENV